MMFDNSPFALTVDEWLEWVPVVTVEELEGE
jgi:hypothetical protein